MPRHLISGTHEWINEIPIVPSYISVKPQPRERAWDYQRGKKTSGVLVKTCFLKSIDNACDRVCPLEQSSNKGNTPG